MSTKLNDIRYGITRKLDACGHEIYIIINFFENSYKPAEVFLKIAKIGSTLSGFVDIWAITLSKALRAGVSWDDLYKTFRHQMFEPKDDKYKSIVDAIAVAINEVVMSKQLEHQHIAELDNEIDNDSTTGNT